MEHQKINKKTSKIGWVEIVLVITVILLLMWGYLEKVSFENNAAYTEGVITGIKKGAKGSVYWSFEFYVEDKKIESSVTLSSCKTCKPGDKILIKYDVTNPNNNDLIRVLP